MNAMSRYELGQFDKAAYDHGMSVVQEMRDVTGVKDGDAHFVVIAVYADGYLQFAGANAAVNVHIDRLAAKQQAMLILGRMGSHGEIDKQPSASTPPRKGKWKNGRRYEYEYAYCSECGRMQWAGWDTHKQAEENIESFACDYKYCPGCGAEMEGGVYVQ